MLKPTKPTQYEKQAAKTHAKGWLSDEDRKATVASLRKEKSNTLWNVLTPFRKDKKGWGY